MSDYTPDTEEVRNGYLVVFIREAQERRSAEFDRWLDQYTAAKRAEWETEQSETLRKIEKFLSDAEEVGRITDPGERFGTPAEKAAGVVDRAWRTGLRQILIPATNNESEGKA